MKLSAVKTKLFRDDIGRVLSQSSSLSKEEACYLLWKFSKENLPRFVTLNIGQLDTKCTAWGFEHPQRGTVHMTRVSGLQDILDSRLEWHADGEWEEGEGPREKTVGDVLGIARQTVLDNAQLFRISASLGALKDCPRTHQSAAVRACWCLRGHLDKGLVDCDALLRKVVEQVGWHKLHAALVEAALTSEYACRSSHCVLT